MAVLILGQGNLNRDEWLELLAIEYTLTMYPTYYSDEEYEKACDKLNELRELKSR